MERDLKKQMAPVAGILTLLLLAACGAASTASTSTTTGLKSTVATKPGSSPKVAGANPRPNSSQSSTSGISAACNRVTPTDISAAQPGTWVAQAPTVRPASWLKIENEDGLYNSLEPPALIQSDVQCTWKMTSPPPPGDFAIPDFQYDLYILNRPVSGRDFLKVVSMGTGLAVPKVGSWAYYFGQWQGTYDGTIFAAANTSLVDADFSYLPTVQPASMAPLVRKIIGE